MKRTLLAVAIAVVLSMTFAPHSGRSLLPFMGHAHGPFFIQPSRVDWKQLGLQTIVIVLLFASIVNIPWQNKRE